MKIAFIFMIVLLLFIGGCINKEKMDVNEVTLKTEDGVNIKASHYPGGENGIVLLHMLGRNRHDWDDFAKELNKLGYNVIAPDLRGHGDSELDYNDFSDEDFNKMMYDVESVVDYIKTSKVFIVGASIGANIAVNYASEEEVNGIVLLSPGEDYHGVKTYDSMRLYKGPMYVVVSEDDLQSIRASQQLYALAEGDKEIKTYANAGHGTNMFGQIDLTHSIIEWLEERK